MNRPTNDDKTNNHELEDTEVGSTGHALSDEQEPIMEQRRQPPRNGDNAYDLVFTKIERSHDTENSEAPDKEKVHDKNEAEDEVTAVDKKPNNGLFSEEENNMEFATSLTENSYSIIYIADPYTLAFVSGIGFFLFQVSLPALALIRLVGKSLNRLTSFTYSSIVEFSHTPCRF